MPIIQALGRKEEGQKFKVISGTQEIPCQAGLQGLGFILNLTGSSIAF